MQCFVYFSSSPGKEQEASLPCFPGWPAAEEEACTLGTRDPHQALSGVLWASTVSGPFFPFPPAFEFVSPLKPRTVDPLPYLVPLWEADVYVDASGGQSGSLASASTGDPESLAFIPCRNPGVTIAYLLQGDERFCGKL